MIRKHIDYDPELEACVLGIFLLEPHCFGACYGIVSEDCFYMPEHVLVFREIEEYWKMGGQIDLLTISRRFYEKEVLDIAGGKTGWFLAGLMRNVVSSAHIETWCLFLRELGARRIMINLTSGGLNKEENIFESATTIQKKLQKALDIKTTNDWLNITEVTNQLLQNMESARENGNSGLATGYDGIDQVNGGFKSGNMIVIAARPAVGKSALMGKIAKTLVKNGKRVGVISLEMPASDVFARMVSAESGIPYWIIDRGMTSDEETRKKIMNSISLMNNAPLFFSETAKVNAYDIRAKAEKLQRTHGLDILFIDYIQLIESEAGKNKTRENEVSAISRAIKLIAMDLKIPVVVLAQLNRQAANGEKPELHHLRESGAIEQDADVVIFVHRDYVSGKKENEHGDSTEFEADLLVRKWRNGKPHELKIKFNPETMDFYEDTPYKTIPDNPHSPALKSHYEVDKSDAPF